MPRMKNLPPYDSNEITKWFSELYGCDQPRAAKHFDAARILSTNSFRDNPDKWPQFLIFDHQTGEWHGADIP
jgi:hypothetical protein